MGFGWTVNPSIPWIISAIFLTIVYFGVFSVFQAVWYDILPLPKLTSAATSPLLMGNTRRVRKRPKVLYGTLWLVCYRLPRIHL